MPIGAEHIIRRGSDAEIRTQPGALRPRALALKQLIYDW